MGIGCRFYEHRYPEVEDVVMVNVREIQDMGAYVRLSEYNDIEGMILLSELSRRRIRSINKLIRVGRSECVVVIRVDKEKGYIDLSKRRVSPEEVEKCEEKYAKGKCIHSILTHVGSILKYETDEELEELYYKTAWFFDRKYGKPGACFEAFKQAVTTPEIIDECELDDDTKQVLIENIKRRLTPQAVKIRSDLEVACYDYEGIDAVKRALRKGLELATEEMPVKINLIAPPVYVLSLQTLERADGVKRLEEAIDKIKASILEEGGVFNVKMAPKVVSQAEETELAKELEKLEKQNQEVGGDSDEDSYSDEEGSEGSEEDEGEA